MVKKIVIFYATAGIGHKKAAYAIKEAFDEKGEKDILLEDALDYTNGFFKRSYNSIYMSLVKYLPTLWGLFYYLLDNPWVYALISPMRRIINHVNSKRLIKFLLNTKPKAVIATHFFSAEVVANLKKRGVLQTRLITVMTDYKSHIFWFSKYTDCYVVGSDFTKDDLVRRGISAERIKVFGIPCTKSFSEERNRERLKSKMGLEPDKRTVFILGGGFGVGPIKSIVLRLDKIEQDFQGIVVCGYNERLHKVMKKTALSLKHFFKIYSFVNNIDELMAMSDILISKPGGMTVTEALNAVVPMVVVDPIPGQEMRNYKFLERHNAAVKLKSPGEIVNIAEELFSSDKLRTLKQNILKLRLVNSAERIVNEATTYGG